MKEQVRQNVTLSLPEPLLRRFRVYAAERNSSMTALMTEAVANLLDRESRYESSKRRFFERVARSGERKTKGKIDWTRDEIHGR